MGHSWWSVPVFLATLIAYFDKENRQIYRNRLNFPLDSRRIGFQPDDFLMPMSLFRLEA